MNKVKSKHSWARFRMFGTWWHICVCCGVVVETNSEFGQVKGRFQKKNFIDQRIEIESKECPIIDFWEEFIPRAIKKGTLTNQEVNSLNGSFYNYLALMDDKFQEKKV